MKQAKRAPPALIDDVRGKLLALAGISIDDLARDVKKAHRKLVSLLDAKTKRYFQHEGEVVGERVDEDTELQRKAAKDLLEFAGASKSKGSGGKSDVHLHLHVEKPWVKDDRPKPDDSDVVDGECGPSPGGS